MFDNVALNLIIQTNIYILKFESLLDCSTVVDPGLSDHMRWPRGWQLALQVAGRPAGRLRCAPICSSRHTCGKRQVYVAKLHVTRFWLISIMKNFTANA